MGREQIQKITVHPPLGPEDRSTAERISAFHAELVERRLSRSGLATAQQCAVLDGLLATLRGRADL